MGNQSSSADTKKEVQTFGTSHFKAAAATMMGCRNTMEDAHCIHCTDDYALFGVFDGHAGSECATYCASHLNEELGKCSLPFEEKTLTEVMLSMDEDVRKQNGAGSTACFMIATCIRPGEYELQIANVGDSRCLLGRNGGAECTVMTTDHRPSNATERQRIERCGGFVEADRVDGLLGVARALGDGKFKKGPGSPLEQKVIAQPDVTRVTCATDDLVVIACDGVFEGRFRNADVMKFIRTTLQVNGHDLAQAAAAVCDEALRRGSSDNITCMIIQFTDGSGLETGASTVVSRSHSGKVLKTKRAYNSVAGRAGSTVDSVRSRFHPKRSSSGPVASGSSLDLKLKPRPNSVC